MITERDIAEKFSVIWKQHFPLLNANFMKVFNGTEVKTINDRFIPINHEVRYDLVSELAFNLACELYSTDKDIDELFDDRESITGLIQNTARDIWKSTNYSPNDLLLNQFEINDSKLICTNILDFVAKLRTGEHHFKPVLKGFGIIPKLTADISIDDTLYELKTVNRNFRSSDLKQLFIYLALQHVSGEMKWKYGGLYNPRRGVYCTFNIRSLIYDLSGGRSSNEVFENFLTGLSRDIQIDSKF